MTLPQPILESIMSVGVDMHKSQEWAQHDVWVSLPSVPPAICFMSCWCLLGTAGSELCLGNSYPIFNHSSKRFPDTFLYPHP